MKHIKCLLWYSFFADSYDKRVFSETGHFFTEHLTIDPHRDLAAVLRRFTDVLPGATRSIYLGLEPGFCSLVAMG